MTTGKIFRAGNSDLVAIPQPWLREWGVSTGQEVFLEKVPDSDAVLVFPARKKSKNRATAGEFKKWLDVVLKEDADLLDELAER